jgi:hypothetical protein
VADLESADESITALKRSGIAFQTLKLARCQFAKCHTDKLASRDDVIADDFFGDLFLLLIQKNAAVKPMLFSVPWTPIRIITPVTQPIMDRRLADVDP